MEQNVEDNETLANKFNPRSNVYNKYGINWRHIRRNNRRNNKKYGRTRETNRSIYHLYDHQMANVIRAPLQFMQ